MDLQAVFNISFSFQDALSVVMSSGPPASFPGHLWHPLHVFGGQTPTVGSHWSGAGLLFTAGQE